MKSGKTKSFSKLKCPEKRLNSKSSANNIKSPNYKKFFPESYSNKKSKDFIKKRIKNNICKREKKQSLSNFSYLKDSDKNKKEHIKKIRKNFKEKQLLLSINNVNTTNNNNIYSLNNTNTNNTIITNTNTNSKNELLTNNNNITSNNNNSNIFNIDDKILLRIHKIKLKYEKKLQNDTLEIKSLLEKNDKLEELVFKLKETLDKANNIFPNFLEQIINTKSEKERESNRTYDIDYIKEENNKLKNENNKIKNEFNQKIELLLKEIKNKQIKKDELYNQKLEKLNNELNTKNSEIKNNINIINDLNNRIKENKKEEEKNEEIIKDMKMEIEKLIIENNEIRNNLKQKEEDLNRVHESNIELNKNFNIIKSNSENEIKNIKEKSNKDIDIKNKENKKLNEIINDQEKVINELKVIIHKNNDKIIEYSQKNNNLKEELDKNNFINNSKLEQMKKELEELSHNYIKKVEAFNEIQKNYELLKSNIINDMDIIKQNSQNKTINQIKEELNKINDKINKLLITENNKEIVNEISSKLSELNNSQNTFISNLPQINQEINKINNRLKIIESYKGKFEEKISNLININNYNNSNTNFTTVSKKREEESMTPNDIKIFSDENIISLEEKSNLNISFEDRVVKKINFSEAEKENELCINNSINNKDTTFDNLKKELQVKESIIRQLQQEIKNLKNNEIIEHKTLVDDEEFNELVDENEELKKLNKELMERLVEFTTSKGNNHSQTLVDYNKDEKILEKNEEINSLRERLEEVYRELNEYRLKNSELNKEIKKIKENDINEKDEIKKLLDKLKSIEIENTNLKELLKLNNNDLNNQNFDNL